MKSPLILGLLISIFSFASHAKSEVTFVVQSTTNLEKHWMKEQALFLLSSDETLRLSCVRTPTGASNLWASVSDANGSRLIAVSPRGRFSNCTRELRELRNDVLAAPRALKFSEQKAQLATGRYVFFSKMEKQDLH